MSKRVKVFIAITVGLVLAGGSFVLLRPKTKSGIVEKEISIKQAETPEIDTLVYKDTSGFTFKYPSLLEVVEVEVDDKTIFSSLELVDKAGEKILVRVVDSVYDNTDEWQEAFEEKNVISAIESVSLVDIPSIQFMFGAPILLKTVGVENKILYTIENLADNGGFYDQAHLQILESFEFDSSVYGEDEEVVSEGGEVSEDIILIEEILE